MAGAPVHVTGLDALTAESGQRGGLSVAAEATVGGLGALLVLALVFASLLALVPLLLAGVYFLLVDIVRRGHSRGPIFLAHLIAGIFAYYFFSGAIRE